MTDKIIIFGKKELEEIDSGIMKIKIIDVNKYLSEFGSEVINKIIISINHPKGAYISQDPSLSITTKNKEDAEWFLNKTGYGHIIYRARLTLDDLYFWEIVDEVAKSILIGILDKIQFKDLLSRAEQVIKKKYFWENKQYPTFLSGYPIKQTWSIKKDFELNKISKKTIYDVRGTSYCGTNTSKEMTTYCKNPHILKWWNQTHDNLIVELINDVQWYWSLYITDKILTVTNSKVIDTWKDKDPLCKKYAWYNILMNFAKSRAYFCGFVKKIKKPTSKTCPRCNNKFIENSLPYSLIEVVGGIKKIDICSPCLTIIYNEGHDNLTRNEIITYFKELSNLLQRVPNYDFGKVKGEFSDFDTKERVKLLNILNNKPTIKRIKEVFGSWFNALIESDLLDDGVRKTSRGTHCLAKDGHHCLSLGEKTIDDILYRYNIVHEKEPYYPESNFRADFLIKGVFVEYFGLVGNVDYDLKIKMKKKLCQKNDIKLISIYPKDLVSTKKLKLKLKNII